MSIIRMDLQEGDLCTDPGCGGKIIFKQEPCNCIAVEMPPCSACENATFICENGDHDVERFLNFVQACSSYWRSSTSIRSLGYHHIDKSDVALVEAYAIARGHQISVYGFWLKCLDEKIYFISDRPPP